MAVNTNNSIDEIKNVCNIVDVVGQVVQLKRAGSNYKGCCPFHNEKTPSFIVSEQKQIFTCFGCGATGDAIEFTKRYYNLDFKEAIEKLGDQYGIQVEFKSSKNSDETNHLYEVNREAAAYFMRAMFTPDNPGFKYITGRGISPETIKKFGLGYADGEWQSLIDYMKSKGYDEQTLFKLGLAAKSEKTGRYYDKFRDRVMFPIINTSGKVIGFGGRIIGQGEPKYMNSPESPIFQKKNNLYALNLTRQDIGKENSAIVVEGNMDVVSLYQAGVHNVCATCGTALTENQAKLLKRYTPNIALSYDADDAGRKAALRGIEILHNEDCKVKVLHVTDGKDPDDYVKKHGAESFRELVRNAMPYADYKLQDLKLKHDVNTEDGRLQYMKNAAKVISVLSPVEADLYIKKVASDMNISEGALRLEVNGAGTSKTNAAPVPSRVSSEEKEKQKASSSLSKLERQLIHILLMEPVHYREIALRQNAFESETGQSIFEAIKLQIKEKPDRTEFDEKRIADSLDVSQAALLREIIDNEPMGGSTEAVLQQCFNTVERKELEKRYSELLSQLELAGDSEVDDSALSEIMEECQFIRDRIEEIKNS